MDLFVQQELHTDRGALKDKGPRDTGQESTPTPTLEGAGTEGAGTEGTQGTSDATPPSSTRCGCARTKILGPKSIMNCVKLLKEAKIK
jgi:hypothetical protein